MQKFPCSRLLVLICLFIAQRRGTAYDPFQQDVNTPYIANFRTKFHPRQSMSFAQVSVLAGFLSLDLTCSSQVLFDGFNLKYADTADLR